MLTRMCTFFSNLRDASSAFKNRVENAIDRHEHDFYKNDHSHVKKQYEEFFTLKKFDGDNRSHDYHKSREFDCGGVRVYLSEVHHRWAANFAAGDFRKSW